MIHVIAIHGVGDHEPGAITPSVEKTISRTEFAGEVEVDEFNWDQLAEHSRHGGPRDLVWLLEATAANISVSARLGLDVGSNRTDTLLGRVQFHLHRFGQWLVALTVAGLLVGAVVQLAARAPASLFGLPVEFGTILSGAATVLALAWLALKTTTITLLGFGILRMAASVSWRPLLTTIRSVVLLYIHPLLVFVSAPLIVEWTGFALMVWFFGGFALIVLLVMYAISLATDEAFMYASTLAYIGVALVASLLIVGIRQKLSNPWFEGLIKVLLDIFRYLGEPAYRSDLQAALDKKVLAAREDCNGSMTIVLAAHSLGSVIAADSLVNSSIWKKTDTVALITMGSPIRRVFQRFYPNVLFADQIGRLGHAIANRTKAFYWVNVYRPFDYIGTGLGLGASGIGRDRSTGQTDRILSSHTDYWGNDDRPEVGNAIVETVSDLQPAAATADAAMHAHVIPDPPTREVLVRRLRSVAGPALLCAAAGLFIAMLWWVSTSVNVRDAGFLDARNRLTDAGVVVPTSVHYDRDTVSTQYSSSLIHHITFRFIPNGTSELLVLAFTLNDDEVFSEVRERFDDRRLIEFVRSSCPEPWWKFWNRGIPCEVSEVGLRHLPGDPETFDLPEFPPQDYRRDTVFGWLRTAFLSFILTLFALVPLGLGASLLMLLLGHASGRRSAKLK